MTARHRKGKSNHRHEENSFKHEALEAESRGGNQYALLFILFLMIVIGGATVAWFCLQQHQTITYLADNLMGVQMKMVKLQTFQEEMRKTNEKLTSSDGLEHRLHALEEAYMQAQKQVGMALATAEQLKTSDLPAQVLSLHTEMKTRLAEVQQATVSTEQLALLQGALRSRSEEFEVVKAEVAALAAAKADMTVTVEGLTGGLATAQSKLEEQASWVGALTTQLEGQVSELLGLKESLALYKAQLETSTQDIASVKELLQAEDAQKAQLVNVEEQLSSVQSSLEEQSSVAQTLHSELKAQLKSIQTQVNQLEGSILDEGRLEQQEEEQAVPALEEEEVAATAPEEVPLDQVVGEEPAAPVSEEVASDQPIAEEEVATPVLDDVPLDQAVEQEEPAAPASEEVTSEEPAAAEAEDIPPGEEEPAEQDTIAQEQEVEAVAEQQEAEAVTEEQEEAVTEEQATETITEEQAEAIAEEPEVDGVTEEHEVEAIAEEQAAPLEEELGLTEEDHVDSEEVVELGDDAPAALEEQEDPVQEEDQIMEEGVEQLEEGDGSPEQESYLTPVRDEEAESLRKARSRQARQTRRSTQGVTLAQLKEAQRTFSLSPADRRTPETPRQADGTGLEREEAKGAPVHFRETEERSPLWSGDVDELGNQRPRPGSQAESLTTPITSPSASGPVLFPSRGLTNRMSSRGLDHNANEWRNENQSALDNPSELVLALRERRQARESNRGASTSYWTQEHDRVSRLDSGSSSGDSTTDRLLGRASSYSRRENRLAALNKADDEAGSKDYKKMYEDALAENEKLKSRLEDSKQELAKIRTQLEKVTQKQDRISERSSVLETEKREKRVLEKKVSEMEEELKVLTELKSDNQRLKDENGALIRVISKLSK